MTLSDVRVRFPRSSVEVRVVSDARFRSACDHRVTAGGRGPAPTSAPCHNEADEASGNQAFTAAARVREVRANVWERT